MVFACMSMGGSGEIHNKKQPENLLLTGWGGVVMLITSCDQRALIRLARWENLNFPMASSHLWEGSLFSDQYVQEGNKPFCAQRIQYLTPYSLISLCHKCFAEN